jgi:Iron-sulfur cluster-binding domain
MPQETNSRFIPEGMTRDCLDPWSYVEIGVAGGVRLCCVRKPVGNLASQTLAHVLHGHEARTLRRDLLSGKPDDICCGCGLRGVINPLDLQQKVREALALGLNSKQFDPAAYLDANPDVKEANVDPAWHFHTWGRIEGRPLNSAASPAEPDG